MFRSTTSPSKYSQSGPSKLVFRYSSTPIRTFALMSPRFRLYARSRFRRLHPRLQPPHTAQPAVVIIGLPPEVFGDFRLRKDQEPLLIESFHHSLGDIFRRNGSFEQEVLRGGHLLAHQHSCA